MRRRKKILATSLAAVLLLGLAAYLAMRPEPAETSYTGAYRLDDGTLVFITPREGEVLRYRQVNGESGALWPEAEGVYSGGPGWAQEAPRTNVFRFQRDEQDRTDALIWERAGEGARTAERLNLPERFATFDSGELTLRGKLVTPVGEGPFATIVLVHGSGAESAVDHYFEPYLYAAHGFASLVFDKRGTGESEGDYLQNFHVLSDDVAAAVRWLRTQPEVDPKNIHLAGFSQGGWIAPLAALKDGDIRSVLVGYGVMKPVTSEDRWGYVYALRQKGFGEAAIAQADEINAIIEDIIDRRENRWADLAVAIDQVRDQPWFDAVKGSDSILGAVADLKYPLWTMRLYFWWRVASQGDPPFIDRTYDPVPVMQRLSTPSLWLLAGEDSSAPAEWTLEELERLQAAGKPVEIHVFPDAEHGILRFEQDAQGERTYLGYEPDYFARQLDWFRRQASDAPRQGGS